MTEDKVVDATVVPTTGGDKPEEVKTEAPKVPAVAMSIHIDLLDNGETKMECTTGMSLDTIRQLLVTMQMQVSDQIALNMAARYLKNMTEKTIIKPNGFRQGKLGKFLSIFK